MQQNVFIIISVLMISLSLAVPSAGEEHYYYFFDQKRPLTLDVEAIAVLQSEDADPADTKVLWQKLGIDEEGVIALPIANWKMATLPLTDRTAEGVGAIVRAAAGGGAVRFASPVFVGDDGGPVIVTPDILVGFHSGVGATQAEGIIAASRAGEITDRKWASMEGVYRLRSGSRNGFDVLEAANALAERPEVKFAEPDMIFTGKASLIPNDTLFSTLWGLHNTGQSGGTPDMDMDAPEAWDITTGDPSVIVVIIDTGVQQDHPDINQIGGNDVTSDGPGDGGPVNVCDNHGTPVAGCVSAIINNNLGVVGTAPDCVSASARTFISNLSCNGRWTTQVSDTVETLAWAESIGASVTNNSNFYGFTSSTIAQKYEDTRNGGMVHFACAGNDGSTNIVYPGNLPTVNAVTALNRNGNLASFATTGVGLAFSAPGVSVGTTDRTGGAGFVGGDFVFIDGCSFATPYTAGVAALVLSLDPSLNAAGVEQIIQQTAVDLGPPGFDTMFGWGFVKAHQALLAVAECTKPADCDDLDNCTLDECINGRCSNTLSINCDDDDVCTFDRCLDLSCVNTANNYGDVNSNGNVDLFDLFCILNGFAGDFPHPQCTFSNVDLDPCPAGNGVIDLFDLFAVLNAFSGIDPCCGGLP